CKYGLIEPPVGSRIRKVRVAGTIRTDLPGIETAIVGWVDRAVDRREELSGLPNENARQLPAAYELIGYSIQTGRQTLPASEGQFIKARRHPAVPWLIRNVRHVHRAIERVERVVPVYIDLIVVACIAQILGPGVLRLQRKAVCELSLECQVERIHLLY